MFPSFELFGRTVYLYQVTALIGALVMGFYACRMTKKRGLDDNETIITLLIAAIGVLIGGRILYAITLLPKLGVLIDSMGEVTFSSVMLLLGTLFGGSVFYGGLFGGIAAGGLYLHLRKLPLRTFADILAPAVPLFHAFGRIGCFLGGCCYGVECSFGFIYTHSLNPSADGVRRFPVQLAESAFLLCLFVLLHLLLKKKKFTGHLFYLYLFLYAAGRFTLEFFRGDAYRGIWAGLSTSQWISLALWLVIPLLWYRDHRKAAQKESADAKQ